jgi:urea transport system ATP-binding protein
VHEIGDIILRLNEELGLSVLLVEQKLPFARRVGDRFVLMDKGRVVRVGPMEQLDDELIEAHLSV